MLFTKKVGLNWYSSMRIFLERFGWFLTSKIHFESPKLSLFDKMSPDGDSKSGNFIWLIDYSWFLAKNLAYAECPIMKFHYRNSSTAEKIFFGLFTVLFYRTNQSFWKSLSIFISYQNTRRVVTFDSCVRLS